MGKQKSKSSKSKKKKTVTASFQSSKKATKSRAGSKFNTKLNYQGSKAKSRSSKKASKQDYKSPEKPSSIEVSKSSNTNVIKPENEPAKLQDPVSEGSVVAVEASNAEQIVNEESNVVGTENEELEKLEFTKPTINQIKKETREQSLRMTSRITSTEFEQLFEGIRQLNSGVQMLKNSYATIIKSLMMLHNRRAKRSKDTKTIPPMVDGKITFLTTLSTCDPKVLRTKSCLEASDKYDIENFLNPGTRDITFQLLFEEVDDLNQRFDLWRPFYDHRGRFRRNFYENQDDVNIERGAFNEFKLWVKKLSSSVDNITRNYNDDLLNIFRLS